MNVELLIKIPSVKHEEVGENRVNIWMDYFY